MNLIERYIYTATKQLPERNREDVEIELRSNIYDMLPDDYNEADVHKVLYELGNPVDLANKYSNKSKYLIGPQHYDGYIHILKLIFIIIICGAPIGGVVTVLLENNVVSPSTTIVDIIVQTIVIMANGCSQAFVWITLIFAILDKSESLYLKWPFTGQEWSVKDLEEPYSKKDGGIEKSEPIFSIVITLVITIAICFFPEYPGWYRFVDGELIMTPLFNLEIVKGYIPFFLVLGLYEVIFATLQLIYQKWTKSLGVLNIGYNIFSVLLMSSFLLNDRIINNNFKVVFAETINSDIEFFMRIWQLSIWMITILICVMGICSIVSGFKNVKKADTE